MGLDNFFGETKSKKKPKKKKELNKEKAQPKISDKDSLREKSNEKIAKVEQISNIEIDKTQTKEQKIITKEAETINENEIEEKSSAEQQKQFHKIINTITEDKDTKNIEIMKKKEKFENYNPGKWYKNESVENIYQLLKESCEKQSRFQFYKKIVKKEILSKNPNIHPEEIAILLEITVGEAYIIMDSILKESS